MPASGPASIARRGGWSPTNIPRSGRAHALRHPQPPAAHVSRAGARGETR